ncbi:hypothetical protein JKF63_07357 [Porcisia hertigi]|uniref:Uncharacterized protein n=1 Tax=Porcisia hertigi TaxID=2761500 RepID=A0A836YGM5_9TRYP|nr:hypothetical protein JKF63_07357 [Porcisia hertigi]
MMDSATCIPSRVLRLPQPLLEPRGSKWASVQPSPDRAALLLRSRHECQLLPISSFVQQEECAAAVAQSTHAGDRVGDESHVVTQQWKTGPSRGRHASGGKVGQRIVLPQPHRQLTTSCWLSAGLNLRSGEIDGAVASDDIAAGAVVGLGDASSMVTIMRSSPFNTTSTPQDTTATWLQSTIFLEEEAEAAAAAMLASGSSLGWHHEHHSSLDKITALRQQSHMGRAPPAARAWRAVEAILPCSYASSFTTSGGGGGGDLTDIYVLCQRADDIYVGSGVAAAGRSSRRPCSSVWLASVQRESAWRVPLATPPGDDEGALDGGGNDATACCSEELSHTTRRTPRLFDVRRRLPPVHEHASPHQRANHPETGPLGLVFAAAFRRHVGLYTAATVTPVVFFELPPWLAGGGGGTRAAHFAPATTSLPRWSSDCCVTAVVEEPSFVETAVPQTPSTISGSGHSYLVTALYNQPNRQRSPTHAAPAKANGSDSGGCCTPLSSSGSCWWLLYDCRNPSAPVWTVEEALAAPPALDDEARHNAPVVTEWLPSPSRVPAPCADFLRSPLCATYVPFETTFTESASAPARLPAGGTCVVLDGGTKMPDCLGSSAQGSDAEDGGATTVFAPIMYELSPPRSLRLPAPGAPPMATSKPPRVRALTFADGVLHYACEEAL